MTTKQTERVETDREFVLREEREGIGFYVRSLSSAEARDALVEHLVSQSEAAWGRVLARSRSSEEARDTLVKERAGIRAHVRSLRESEARDALVEYLVSQVERERNRYHAEQRWLMAAANGS